MFAAIFQSAEPVPTGKHRNKVRQIAVIPADAQAPLVYQRLVSLDKAKRGISGAWYQAHDLRLDNEVQLGYPVSRGITASDIEAIDGGEKPTVLLQKLVRAIDINADEVTDVAESTLSDLFAKALTAPHELAQFSRGRAVKSQPAPAIVLPAVVPADDIELPAPVASVPPQTSAEPEVALANGVTKTRWAQLRYASEPETYIDREIEGLPLQGILDTCVANNRKVLFTGDAGTGKTLTASYLAFRRSVPLVVVECHQSINTDITEGRLMPDPDGGWYWLFSELATAIQQPSVILLNELSRTSPRNATLFLGLLQEGVLRIPTLNLEIPVADGVTFIADQNVGSAYTGAQSQDAALYDRFDVKVEFGDDTRIEGLLVKSPALHEAVASLRYLRNVVRKDIRTRVSTRMILGFAKNIRDFNFGFAIYSFLNNFTESERPTVEMQLQAQAINIAKDFGVDLGSYADRLGTTSSL